MNQNKKSTHHLKKSERIKHHHSTNHPIKNEENKSINPILHAHHEIVKNQDSNAQDLTLKTNLTENIEDESDKKIYESQTYNLMGDPQINSQFPERFSEEIAQLKKRIEQFEEKEENLNEEDEKTHQESNIPNKTE